MARFEEQESVLCRWTDGLLYLGTILKVDERGNRCWIKFEDGSTYWILYKDMQKGSTRDVDILCSLCESGESNEPNQIVMCDNCGLGFHQLCHNPQIPADVLQPDYHWFCQQCARFKAIKVEKIEKKDPELTTLNVIPLPYDLNSLEWDPFHRTNTEHRYCYCGGPGEWYIKMLQCFRCKQWFHEACVQTLKYPMLLGDRSYIFVCSVCNNGVEYVKKLGMKWRDIVHVVLFNLSQDYNKPLFDFEPEIMPFVERHWNLLKQGNAQFAEITSEERKISVLTTLKTNRFRFKCGKESKKRSTSWGLRVVIPPPAPEITLPQSGQVTNDVYQHYKTETSSKSVFVPIPITPNSATKDHQEKDKTPVKKVKSEENLLINSARTFMAPSAKSENPIKIQEFERYRSNKSALMSYEPFYKRKYTKRKPVDGRKSNGRYPRVKTTNSSDEPKPKKKYKKRKNLIGYYSRKSSAKRIPTKKLIKTICEIKTEPQCDDTTNLATCKIEPVTNEDISSHNSDRSSPAGSGTDTPSIYSSNGTQLKLKYLPRNRIRRSVSHESNGVGISQCSTCQRRSFPINSETALIKQKCFVNCHDLTSPLTSTFHHNVGRTVSQTCSSSYLDNGGSVACLICHNCNHRIQRRADGVTKTAYAVGSPETLSCTCTLSVSPM